MKKILVLACIVSGVLSAMDSDLTAKLVEAIKTDDDGQLVEVMKQGVDVAEVIPLEQIYGVTPMLWAARLGNTQIVQKLIDSGVPVNVAYDFDDENTLLIAGTTFCSSPFHFACEYGHTSMVKLLLRNGANVDAVNYLGHTPLHNAVANKHNDIVVLLVQAGARLNTDTKIRGSWSSSSVGEFSLRSSSYSFGTPLNSAVSVGNVIGAKLLIDHGAAVGAKLLVEAYEWGDKKVIKLLKDAGAILTHIPSNKLIEPSKQGNISAVEVLLATGIDLEALDNSTYQATSLLWAANNAHSEVCEMLLKADAKAQAKNKDGKTALDCVEIQMNKIMLAVVQLWDKDELSQEEVKELRASYKKLADYGKIIDLIGYCQQNPPSLKDMCLLMVRNLIKSGALKKSDVLSPEKFGFEHVAEEYLKIRR